MICNFMIFSESVGSGACLSTFTMNLKRMVGYLEQDYVLHYTITQIEVYLRLSRELI